VPLEEPKKKKEGTLLASTPAFTSLALSLLPHTCVLVRSLRTVCVPHRIAAEWSRQTGCPTWNFSLVVVQHPDGRFLAVHESRGRGWWLPAGFVDPGDDLMSAAIRETKEEAGVDVRLEGTALARALIPSGVLTLVSCEN
jgi:hypothetical protein